MLLSGLGQLKIGTAPVTQAIWDTLLALYFEQILYFIISFCLQKSFFFHITTFVAAFLSHLPAPPQESCTSFFNIPNLALVLNQVFPQDNGRLSLLIHSLTDRMLAGNRRWLAVVMRLNILNFVDKGMNFSFTLARIRIRHFALTNKIPAWCKRNTSSTRRVSIPLPLFTRLSQRPPRFILMWNCGLFVFWCHRNKIPQLSPRCTTCVHLQS